MFFTEFASQVKEQVKTAYNTQGIAKEVEVLSTLNSSGSYTALTVKNPNETAYPAISLDGLYDVYQNGASMDAIVDSVLKIVGKPFPKFDLSFLEDYESAKSHLFVKLSPMPVTGKQLVDHPFACVDDLVMTYHLQLLPDSGDENTIMVTHDLLKKFGVTYEEFHRDAMENTRKLFGYEFLSIGPFLSSMGVIDDPPEGVPELFCVTNNRKRYGATALFYPGVKEDIAERLGGGYYILPSSIHEFLVVSDKAIEAEALNEMVRTVNETAVDPKEQLSDHIYQYDPKTKEIVSVLTNI